MVDGGRTNKRKGGADRGLRRAGREERGRMREIRAG